MELEAALRGRRSVREFHPDPIAPDLILKLIEAAAWAPSAVDAQALTYLVIEGGERLDAVSDEIQAYALRHLSREKALGAFRSLGGSGFHAFYRAPALIVVCAPASSPWGAEDACLAAQNLMLTAFERQLGSCWIGFARDWLRSREGRTFLEISDDLLPVAPIAVGWPNAWPTAPARRDQKVRWIS